MLSRGALVALGLGVVAVVVETGPVEFGPVNAQALASIVNHLGRMPDGTYHCGADTGTHYRLVFATRTGDVEVRDNLGGCLDVSISSHGTDWGAGKWDPTGQLAGAIRSDLASTDRR